MSLITKVYQDLDIFVEESDDGSRWMDARTGMRFRENADHTLSLASAGKWKPGKISANPYRDSMLADLWRKLLPIASNPPPIKDADRKDLRSNSDETGESGREFVSRGGAHFMGISVHPKGAYTPVDGLRSIETFMGSELVLRPLSDGRFDERAFWMSGDIFSKPYYLDTTRKIGHESLVGYDSCDLGAHLHQLAKMAMGTGVGESTSAIALALFFRILAHQTGCSSTATQLRGLGHIVGLNTVALLAGFTPEFIDRYCSGMDPAKGLDWWIAMLEGSGAHGARSLWEDVYPHQYLGKADQGLAPILGYNLPDPISLDGKPRDAACYGLLFHHSLLGGWLAISARGLHMLPEHAARAKVLALQARNAFGWMVDRGAIDAETCRFSRVCGPYPLPDTAENRALLNRMVSDGNAYREEKRRAGKDAPDDVEVVVTPLGQLNWREKVRKGDTGLAAGAASMTLDAVEEAGCDAYPAWDEPMRRFVDAYRPEEDTIEHWVYYAPLLRRREAAAEGVGPEN